MENELNKLENMLNEAQAKMDKIKENDKVYNESKKYMDREIELKLQIKHVTDNYKKLLELYDYINLFILNKTDNHNDVEVADKLRDIIMMSLFRLKNDDDLNKFNDSLKNKDYSPDFMEFKNSLLSNDDVDE